MSVQNGDHKAAAETAGAASQDDPLGGFFSNILTPGSSLNPTFLFILDGAFATLFLVFLGLLFITGGNVHLLFLIIIEGCLWASIKWFVSELQNVQAQEAREAAQQGGRTPSEKTSAKSKHE